MPPFARSWDRSSSLLLTPEPRSLFVVAAEASAALQSSLRLAGPWDSYFGCENAPGKTS